MRLLALKRRRVPVALVFLALVFAAIWFAGHRSVHPQFGHIHVAQMSESYSDTKTLWQDRQKAEAIVRSWLHLRAHRSPLPNSDGQGSNHRKGSLLLLN
jgi:hypothetical protein